MSQTDGPRSPASAPPTDAWPTASGGRPDAVDATPRTDRFAVASICCSAAGFVTGVTAILGIAFGFVARTRLARSGGSAKGRGLALGGIVLGLVALLWVSLVVVVMIREADGAPMALATSELLPRSAYPAGWQGQGTELANDDASYFAQATPQEVVQLETCLHMRTAPVDGNPTEAADQPYDARSAPLSASDTLDVFSSTAAAAADAVASGKPNAVACLFQVWPDGGNRFPGYTAGEITSRVRHIPPLGAHDSDVEVRYHYPVNSKDVFYDDYVTVQRGPSEANLVISNIDAPPPAGLVVGLAQAAAKQLAPA